MIIRDLPAWALADRLRRGELVLQTGPFSNRVRSDMANVAKALGLLYSDYPVGEPESFCDFDVSVLQVQGFRRLFKPQSVFVYDGRPVFNPMPADHAHPLLEWALNWCISTQVLNHLTIHAAVIERRGGAVILPAPPGSGKSTLCAGLVHAGWRLLSDELALIDLAGAHAITPLCRPVSLKNTSIEVITQWSKGAAVFTAPSHETIKGTVAHMQVPADHVARVGECARPAAVVFPRWVPGARVQLSPLSKADAVIRLSSNSFNYLALGETGFQVLADVVDACACFEFEYSRLDDAAEVFDRLADGFFR